VIPSEQYGSGTVMVWDRGTWVPSENRSAAIATACSSSSSTGKLRAGGRWYHARRKQGQERENWLLIKEKDEFARHGADAHIVDTAPNSVLSGRTIEAIARDRDRVWQSSKSADARVRANKATRKIPARKGEQADPAEVDGAKRARLPATLTDARDACEDCSARRRVAARDQARWLPRCAVWIEGPSASLRGAAGSGHRHCR
jgi:bifunctional non-homologous end joining protein LigD